MVTCRPRPQLEKSRKRRLNRTMNTIQKGQKENVEKTNQTVYRNVYLRRQSVARYVMRTCYMLSPNFYTCTNIINILH